MPAVGNPPTLREFLAAYGESIRGSRSSTADTRTGSAYDLAGGVSAIVWSKEVQRDRRLFRQVYTDTAEGEDLDRLVEQKYDTTRTVASYGTGTLVLTRPAAASANGVVYAGTRVEYRVPGAIPVPYAVYVDTTIPAGATWFPVPVRATTTGAGVACKADAANLALPDPLFDATLTAHGLTCSDGTDEEPAADYLARARQAKSDRRNGYPTRIIEALQEAGASEVVLLDAHALGDANDFGLSYAYVADSGFSSPTALIKACMIALDEVIVAGTDVQVLGMTPTPITLTTTVALTDDPGAFDQDDIKQGIVAALLEEFSQRNQWWTFRWSSLESVISKTHYAIQQATVTTSPTEPAVSFPAALPRYTLASTSITINLTGPT